MDSCWLSIGSSVLVSVNMTINNSGGGAWAVGGDTALSSSPSPTAGQIADSSRGGDDCYNTHYINKDV